MSNAIIKSEPTMQLIWDLPVRLWHWLLTGSFIAAAVISLAIGEDSSLFPYHSILGLVMVLMVVLRLIWGVIGTRHARLGALAFAPSALLSYLRGVAFGGAPRFAAHNPGAAYATIAMLVLILVIGGTGLALSQGNDRVKELHELGVYALLAVAGAHILGVIAHTLRHREAIALSMIHGRKTASPADAIRSSRPLAALLFLLIVGAWGFGLVRAYDPAAQTTTLPLTGLVLRLGEEAESGGEPAGRDEAARHKGDRGEADHDEDDD